MNRKVIFAVAESFLFILLLVWIFLTVAYFAPNVHLNGFPHLDLSASSESNQNISSIPAIQTVSRLGVVFVYLGSFILITYIAIMLLLYFIKINKTKILYCNITFYAVGTILLVLGILFVLLKL
ncbi:MAG: hypothetical protein HUJ42_03125 [Malacoplasma sp.]|nr:hypothetical protein [Malacoplasma sp.]